MRASHSNGQSKWPSTTGAPSWPGMAACWLKGAQCTGARFAPSTRSAAVDRAGLTERARKKLLLMSSRRLELGLKSKKEEINSDSLLLPLGRH